MYTHQKYLFAINFFVTYCCSAGFRELATMRWCVRSCTEWECGPTAAKAAPRRRLFRQLLVWEVLGQLDWGSQSRTDKDGGVEKMSLFGVLKQHPSTGRAILGLEVRIPCRWEVLGVWGLSCGEKEPVAQEGFGNGSAFTAQEGLRDKGTKVSAPSLLCSCQVCFDMVLRVSCCC